MRPRRTTSREHRVSGGADEWTIYALTAARLPSTIQIGGRTVGVLRVGPIGVVGRTPDGDTSYTETALRDQHEIVLALAEKFDPLLPVRFGTKMTRDDLHDTIRRSADVLSIALENVKGRRQMTLRLIGAPVRAQISAPERSGAAYLQRRRAAYAIPGELDPLREAVRRFVAEERVAPGRADVRITLFHLVERDCIGGYEEAVEHTSKTVPPGCVTVSGPWPPFAFAPELPA